MEFRVWGSGSRTLHRAFGRAALPVLVLDARVGTAATIGSEAVLPAPPRKALAGSVALATSMLVAGTWGLGFEVWGVGFGVEV